MKMTPIEIVCFFHCSLVAVEEALIPLEDDNKITFAVLCDDKDQEMVETLFCRDLPL
jgi:hypothetical protein